jgi:hypothetical protein
MQRTATGRCRVSLTVGLTIQAHIRHQGIPQASNYPSLCHVVHLENLAYSLYQIVTDSLLKSKPLRDGTYCRSLSNVFGIKIKRYLAMKTASKKARELKPK